ncbi:hypothetical protein [Bradyrhizobium sp. LA2.1]|uniref:hypothetical protein n=1 Tax=Bradyrhizobium sp. LA2.1 TaxID=3156376 RepID=UPI003397EA5A
MRNFYLKSLDAVLQGLRNARGPARIYRRKFITVAKRMKRRERRRFIVLARRLQQAYNRRTFQFALTSRPILLKVKRLLLTVYATLFSVLLTFLFLLSATQTSGWKASEVNLTAAQIIGAALALVLSLSIIPAQRAAELFSMAILKLYAKDGSLLGAFFVLVATTMVSLLLGSNWLADFDPRGPIGIQFLLMGISFDALRWFYVRTLDLLVPQSAIQLVIRECNAQIVEATATADRLLRIDDAAKDHDHDFIRAKVITASGVPRVLKYWTAQLEEFAHRFIARKDTSVVDGITEGLVNIGARYIEGRKDSVILHLDASNPFAGRLSDIEDVLNPIYESMQLIIRAAIGSANERIVRNAVAQQGTLALLAVGVTSAGASGVQAAPLAFAAAYFLDRSVRDAESASMIDAVLVGIRSLEALLMARKPDVLTNEMESQVRESLFELARASFRRAESHIVPYRAVTGMLTCAAYEIENREFSETDFGELLERISQLLPYELRADSSNQRRLMVFPPYSMSYEHSIPMLLQRVASKVTVDNEREWIDPFTDFLEASAGVRNHYRQISGMAFPDALLRKWIVDSLLACVQVHLHLLKSPVEGTETFLRPVESSAKHLISWTPAFFSSSPSKFAANDAANGLAVIGIRALEESWVEIARACGKALAALAGNSAGVKPEPYALADLQERLEILARAADTLGSNALASEFRAMIVRPSNIPDTDWPSFLSARTTRFEQLDESLEKAGRRSPRGDDPIEELNSLIVRKKVRNAINGT